MECFPLFYHLWPDCNHRRGGRSPQHPITGFQRVVNSWRHPPLCHQRGWQPTSRGAPRFTRGPLKKPLTQPRGGQTSVINIWFVFCCNAKAKKKAEPGGGEEDGDGRNDESGKVDWRRIHRRRWFPWVSTRTSGVWRWLHSHEPQPMMPVAPLA